MIRITHLHTVFQQGRTTMTISRYNGTLNNRLHGWFGDASGFTEAYCRTFYGGADHKMMALTILPSRPLIPMLVNTRDSGVDLKVTAVFMGYCK